MAPLRPASPQSRARRGRREEGGGERKRMAGGPGGKMVYLHLRSAENDYYNCYDVLQTKSSIHGVLETILIFVVCYTQNYIFTVSCRQISLIKTTGYKVTEDTGQDTSSTRKSHLGAS